MNIEAAEQKPMEVVEQRKRVELLHPINHDGILFSRGVHELDESLARLFVTFKDPISKKPIAREWIPNTTGPVRGTTKATS